MFLMKKLMAFNANFCLVLFLISSVFFSQNVLSQTKQKTLFQNTITTAAIKSLAQVRLVSGYLDTLWIDSSKFANLSKRLVMRFYIDSSGLLTLRGWENDDDNFQDQGKIIFNNAHPSNVKFGPGSYLGNLVIRSDELKIIKRKLERKHSKFVVFCPHDDATDPDGDIGQITYDIYVSMVDPSKSALSPMALTPTGQQANPSPPRNPR